MSSASGTEGANDLARPYEEGAECRMGCDRRGIGSYGRPCLRGAVHRLFATIDVATLAASSFSVDPDKAGDAS